MRSTRNGWLGRLDARYDAIAIEHTGAWMGGVRLVLGILVGALAVLFRDRLLVAAPMLVIALALVADGALILLWQRRWGTSRASRHGERSEDLGDGLPPIASDAHVGGARDNGDV